VEAIDLGLLAGGTTGLLFIATTLANPFKNFKWFRNSWAIPLAFIIALAFAIGWMLVNKVIVIQGNTVGVVDWKALFYNVTGGLMGGALSPGGYTAQKNLLGNKALLQPGPNNNSYDVAKAQAALEAINQITGQTPGGGES
jgi:hypothetical protein